MNNLEVTLFLNEPELIILQTFKGLKYCYLIYWYIDLIYLIYL